MFFNSAAREEDLRIEKERKEAEKKAASKSYTDELMKKYYLEQAEKDLIHEAQEKQYVLNRKKLYTMAHYSRIQTQDDTKVERVPGGWIFYKSTGKTQTSTFVPFAEEKIEMFYKLKNE